MTAAEPCSTQPAHCVDLVDEDDARRMLLALLKEISHTRGSDPDEHFDEVRPADAEERNPCFSRDGLGQQRFSRAGWAHDQNALGDPTAQLLKPAGILEEFDDLHDLFFRLVDSGDVGKRDFFSLFGQQPGPTLPERERLVPADLHLPHQEEPQANKQNEGSPREQEVDVPRILVRRFGFNLDISFPEHLHHVRILSRIGPDAGPVLQDRADMVSLDDDLGDLAFIQLSHEVAENDLLFRGMGRDAEQVEQQDHEQTHDHPEQQILHPGIHPIPPLALTERRGQEHRIVGV